VEGEPRAQGERRYMKFWGPDNGPVDFMGVAEATISKQVYVHKETKDT